MASMAACLLRPDGSIQANEAILVAASTANSTADAAYFAFSGTLGMAMAGSFLVFLMHFLLTVLLRKLTLRLAPRLLQRQDEKVTVQPFIETPAAAMLVRSESVA